MHLLCVFFNKHASLVCCALYFKMAHQIQSKLNLEMLLHHTTCKFSTFIIYIFLFIGFLVLSQKKKSSMFMNTGSRSGNCTFVSMMTWSMDSSGVPILDTCVMMTMYMGAMNLVPFWLIYLVSTITSAVI